MDKIFRDTVFAGVSDRDMAEILVCEMHRRRLIGCVYLFPETGGAGVFASASPAGTLSDLSAAQQLVVFATLAGKALHERKNVLPDETDTEGGWVN